MSNTSDLDSSTEVTNESPPEQQPTTEQEQETTGETSATQSVPEVEETSPSGTGKLWFFGVLIFLLLVVVIAGGYFFITQSKNSIAWEPVSQKKAAPKDMTQEKDELFRSPTIIQPMINAQQTKPEEIAYAGKSLSPSSTISFTKEPTSMESLAIKQGLLNPTIKKEKVVYFSVEEEVKALGNSMDSMEKKFASYDKAATALHKAYKKDIDSLAMKNERTNASIINIHSKLSKLNTDVAAIAKSSTNTKEIEAALEKIQAYKKSITSVIDSSNQNNRNIKWLSRYRLCVLEKRLNISEFNKQCTQYNKGQNKTQPTPVNHVSESVKPIIASTSSYQNEVPNTVGTKDSGSYVTNTSLNITPRPSNACSNASRDWRLMLISNHRALIMRNTDMEEAVIEKGSYITGLGNVQAFITNGSNPYVQFSSTIVCGG
jgi:hypothetical protein